MVETVNKFPLAAITIPAMTVSSYWDRWWSFNVTFPVQDHIRQMHTEGLSSQLHKKHIIQTSKSNYMCIERLVDSPRSLHFNYTPALSIIKSKESWNCKILVFYLLSRTVQLF